jgi:hypothetical protein
MMANGSNMSTLSQMEIIAWSVPDGFDFTPDDKT